MSRAMQREDVWWDTKNTMDFWISVWSNVSARRSNQFILKEISPEYSLEGLMLKLKLQFFGHLMWRTDSFEKTLMLWKIGGGRRGDDRGWDGWMASLTRWAWVWVNSGSWRWRGKPGVLHSMGLQRIRHDWVTELNWIELSYLLCTLGKLLHSFIPGIPTHKVRFLEQMIQLFY